MSFIGTALTTSLDSLIGDIASPYALIYSPSRNIGGIFADVTVSEVGTDEFTITVSPVETGTPTSDHTYANPQIIEIRFGFSDSSGGYTGYTVDQYNEILALAATQEPFDVSTGKRYYSNMLFGQITQITDEQFESSGMFTVRLQQVIIADTDSGSLDQSNQANPSETSPSVNNGSTGLQAAPNASLYADYENNFTQTSGTAGLGAH